MSAETSAVRGGRLRAAGIRPASGAPVERFGPIKLRHPIHAWAIRTVRRIGRLLGDDMDAAPSSWAIPNPAPFLDDADHSLAADLVRAAIAIGNDAEEHDIYLPEERARYRALSLRLYEHGLSVLRSERAPSTDSGR